MTLLAPQPIFSIGSDRKSEQISESVDHPTILVVREAPGGHVRRLFTVWNRGYKTLNVIALDVNEALTICVKAKHLRRADKYRRFQDATELPQEAGTAEMLTRALEAGRSGVATLDPQNGWVIDGTPT